MNLKDFSFKNPLSRFLLLALLAYLVWYCSYEFFLKPATGLDEWVISLIISHSEWFMHTLGLNLIEDKLAWNHIGIQGSAGVLIGAPCDGIILFAIFSIFILAFPGQLKHKLWYLPCGILSIHSVNILRVVALAAIVKQNESWLQFNHDYTFTILTYAWVFLLWYVWVSRFSPLKKIKS